MSGAARKTASLTLESGRDFSQTALENLMQSFSGKPTLTKNKRVIILYKKFFVRSIDIY
jgi:hypothetical protein